MRQMITGLALLSLACLASTALADIEIRRGGSSWALVENNGTVRINGSSPLEHLG